MASRVEYAVSLTPIRTVAASGDYAAHDVMAMLPEETLPGLRSPLV